MSSVYRYHAGMVGEVVIDTLNASTSFVTFHVVPHDFRSILNVARSGVNSLATVGVQKKGYIEPSCAVQFLISDILAIFRMREPINDDSPIEVPKDHVAISE